MSKLALYLTEHLIKCMVQFEAGAWEKGLLLAKKVSLSKLTFEKRNPGATVYNPFS